MGIPIRGAIGNAIAMNACARQVSAQSLTGGPVMCIQHGTCCSLYMLMTSRCPAPAVCLATGWSLIREHIKTEDPLTLDKHLGRTHRVQQVPYNMLNPTMVALLTQTPPTTTKVPKDSSSSTQLAQPGGISDVAAGAPEQKTRGEVTTWLPRAGTPMSSLRIWEISYPNVLSCTWNLLGLALPRSEKFPHHSLNKLPRRSSMSPPPVFLLPSHHVSL